MFCVVSIMSYEAGSRLSKEGERGLRVKGQGSALAVVNGYLNCFN